MKTCTALIAIALCASLIGCAVQGPPRTSTGWTQADINAALAAANRRCDERIADPRIDPIRQYIPLSGPESASLQQIASKKKPNAREKDAILVWDAALAECTQDLRDIDIAAGININSPYHVNSNTLYSAQKQAKAQLWAGQISYGQYIEISVANRKKHSEREQEITDGIRAAEIQRAQAIAQQQQANAQTLMLFNRAASQYRQPVQTNCIKYGNQTNCTSY